MMKRWILITFLITLLLALTMYCIPLYQDQQVMTFPNWNKTHKLTKEIIESDAHNAFVEIYLNEEAKDAYIEVKSEFPVGSEVFKPLYADKKGEHFARLVIMVKMHKGYDSANGDWWYGVYDESGTEMAYEGKIPECISCHVVAKETDYMFSRSVMMKLRGVDTNEYEVYDPDDEDY